MLQERNILGQTPLHLAVAKPDCLSLLVKAAAGSSKILDCVDSEGFTPLETAMMMSTNICRSQNQKRKCSRCGCAQTVCIMLSAGCAVYEPTELTLDQASNRALRRFARHMAHRRSGLKELALEHQSVREDGFFEFDDDRIPDHCAKHLVEILTKHDIKIPGPLKLRANPDPIRWDRHHYESIYIRLGRSWQAEVFWGFGFRDINYPSPYGKMSPLFRAARRLGLNTDYLYWLLEHGADPLMRLSPEGGAKQGKRLSWYGTARLETASWAHRLYYSAGETIGWPLQRSARKDVEALERLNVQFLHLDLTDRCRCKCITGGCTLQNCLLKGIDCFDPDENGPVCAVSISNAMCWYYKQFSMSIPYHHLRDTIRFATFTALGATHTCCRDEVFGLSPFLKDPEEISFLQEEESHLLEILERLVTEFDRQFYAILDTQPDNHEKLSEFWGVHWLPRMQEVLVELDTADLPEEVKRSTEEIGVVWHGPERLPAREPAVDRDSLDYWFGELDKIVGKK